MRPFKRILCPIDLSENSKTAIQLASSLAKSYQAQLVFVFVGPSPLPPVAKHADDEMQKLIDGYTNQLAQIRPTEENIEVEHVVLQGPPAETLMEYAEESNADAFVLSTHGRTGITRFLMGSVAEEIVRKSPIPVVTVRYPG